MPKGNGAAGSREPLQRISEIADLLSISRSAIYGLMDSGRLPYVKIGKSRRLKLEDVLKLIAENTTARD